jgi:hypothetical protein
MKRIGPRPKKRDRNRCRASVGLGSLYSQVAGEPLAYLRELRRDFMLV